MRNSVLVIVMVAVALSLVGPAVAQANFNCDMAELLLAMGGGKGTPGYYWYAALCLVTMAMEAAGQWMA